MPSDSTYEIGMLANADAYTSDTLDGTGHVKVTVSPSCVRVDYIRAYLPADTVSGEHHNREVAFSYTIGNCASTGIAEPEALETVMLFPNPANDKLTIQSNSSGSSLLTTFQNAMGQTLFQTSLNVIDIRQIPNGMYLLTIETNDSRVVRKLLVNH